MATAEGAMKIWQVRREKYGPSGRGVPFPEPDIRPIRIEGDIAYVPLTRGKVAIIDAADVHLVEGRNWAAFQSKTGIFYASTNRRVSDGKGPCRLYLHRLIMQPEGRQEVDHESMDGLDCRRANMRIATKPENSRNKRAYSTNTCGIKGVAWRPDKQKWRARIMVEGKEIHLGHHSTIEAAAEAYRQASIKFHGDFGRSA